MAVQIIIQLAIFFFLFQYKSVTDNVGKRVNLFGVMFEINSGTNKNNPITKIIMGKKEN